MILESSASVTSEKQLRVGPSQGVGSEGGAGWFEAARVMLFLMFSIFVIIII